MIIGHAAYLTCVCSDHMEAGIDLQACGTWLFALFPSTGTACVCVLSFQTRLLCGTRFSRVLQNLHRVSRRDPSVHQVTPSHGHLSPLHWRRTVVHQNKSQVRAQCHHSAQSKKPWSDTRRICCNQDIWQSAQSAHFDREKPPALFGLSV